MQRSFPQRSAAKTSNLSLLADTKLFSTLSLAAQRKGSPCASSSEEGPLYLLSSPAPPTHDGKLERERNRMIERERDLLLYVYCETPEP